MTLRSVTFYLPQFHPIPENDRRWGAGFTAWTNIARARPLSPRHRQPHLPGDLGFDDLRVPEVRLAQADLARSYGLSTFCYYPWLQGRQVLQRPFEEVLPAQRTCGAARPSATTKSCEPRSAGRCPRTRAGLA